MTMAAEIKNRMQTVPTTPGIGSGASKVELGKTPSSNKGGGCC